MNLGADLNAVEKIRCLKNRHRKKFTTLSSSVLEPQESVWEWL